ncbi:MAG TPA: hypothetical protein VIG99_30775 [Myxococcaceae bacterium]
MDAAVAALAAGRCDLGAFASGRQAPEVRLRFEGPPEQAVAGAGALGPGGVSVGAYRVEGDEVRVWIPDDPWLAEAALRLAMSVAFERQGGLLLHAAGIAFAGGAGAWLAVGASGRGKSTLAQYCSDAGAEVLSDETVGWLPDGTLWATPFRSTARFTRSRPLEPRPFSVLAFLEHGEAERLEAMGEAEAVRQVLSQTYRVPGAPVLHRAATLVAQRGAQRFWFRNDPGVAAFVGRS